MNKTLLFCFFIISLTITLLSIPSYLIGLSADGSSESIGMKCYNMAIGILSLLIPTIIFYISFRHIKRDENTLVVIGDLVPVLRAVGLCVGVYILIGQARMLISLSKFRSIDSNDFLSLIQTLSIIVASIYLKKIVFIFIDEKPNKSIHRTAE